MQARAHYTYQQTVEIQEFSSGPASSARPGVYREKREVIFSPHGERTERMVGAPVNNLNRLRLTPEDFEDIRDVQPFLLTAETLWMYRIRPKGEETVDGVECWILEASPRQTLDGQRLFEGLLWIDKQDHSVVKTEGVAVPKILRKHEENLFPRFTTFREKVDGFRFPVHTHSDDTLMFSSGPIRQRMTIRYENYRRFGAESTVTFDEPKR